MLSQSLLPILMTLIIIYTTILDTVLVCTVISVYSPEVQPPILMYINNSLYNNNIVCSMTYTVFVIHL